MRCLIGIEEFRGGKHLAQTFAKCGFTRGNPSGDSDGRHSSQKQKPQCFWNTFILPISDNLSNPPNVAVGRKNPHRNAGAFGAARKPVLTLLTRLRLAALARTSARRETLAAREDITAWQCDRVFASFLYASVA